MFRLTTANDGQLPIGMYLEIDVNFLGLKVLDVGFLITKDPNHILDEKHHTKMPGVVGWNMKWLAYNAFIQKLSTCEW